MKNSQGKISFIFPGQGAQYIGMGQSLHDDFPAARFVFEEANDTLGYDLKKICFEGSIDLLSKTEITQPAILTTSIAILRVVESLGLQADFCAGLSLGEYSALVYSGAFKFSDALSLVRYRGKVMQEAVPEGTGGMMALIGIDRSKAEDLCQAYRQYGTLQCSNFNCPGQIVIGGDIKPLTLAQESHKRFGVKKAIRLPVSAPFHTPLLNPAADKLEKALERIPLGSLNVPIVTNVDASINRDLSEIKQKLKMQVCSVVLWEDSVAKLIEEGTETFIEIGPGKSLSGFLKKIDPLKNRYNIEDLSSLSHCMEIMEGKYD